MIHPTAIIHPQAQLDPSVEVGPYAVIDGHVSMGPGCRVGPHVYLTGHTRIGANNRFYAGCVIGEAPQDVKYKDEPTELRMGDNNLVREGATVHRSAKAGEATRHRLEQFFDGQFPRRPQRCCRRPCHPGQRRFAGRAMLKSGDRAFISGNCLVHQFVRVGTLAIMQGGSAISKDLPPYTVARGDNGMCGLNIVGLRRAGFSAAERLELKKLYHKLFRSGENLSGAAAQARREFTSAPAKVLLDFVASATRGVCRDSGR